MCNKSPTRPWFLQCVKYQGKGLLTINPTVTSELNQLRELWGTILYDFSIFFRGWIPEEIPQNLAGSICSWDAHRYLWNARSFQQTGAEYGRGGVEEFCGNM